jgi:signal transduction histidine kinase
VAEAREPPDWLGRLAHDLRNPITPMRSAVQLLQLGGLPPELGPDLLRTLDRQIDFLLHTIDDVADLVKIERGAFQLQLAACDLDAVVDAALARAGRAAARGRPPPAVEVQRAAQPLTVRADEIRLRQAIEHLAGYVLDADNPEPASVRTLERAGRACVRLRAGGRALAPDARLDYLMTGGRPTDESAVTLGVRVVRHVLEMHGATLALADDGATLELDLPLAAP